MFLRLKVSFVLFILISSSFSQAAEKCLKQFTGSLRQVQHTVSTRSSFQHLPQFKNMTEEIELSKHWAGKPSEGIRALTRFLPKDVSFIDHALRESPSKSLVKFEDKGSSIIVRAGYESQKKLLETNVTLTGFGLMNNINQSQKWLIGPHVPIGILFLHGGGTKSTGGHVAYHLSNHFKKYNIAVVSPDLPWHGEGPRAVMGNLDQEILALSAFAKKYIHPKVPLFVWGHSWGGSLAHRIMQMTGEQKKGFFHQNLKGLIITSPMVDPAPGKPVNEKRSSSFKRREEVLTTKKDQIAPYDIDIFTNVVLDGKASPVGEFFLYTTGYQLNDTIPDHKGKNYLPSLMVVGKGDPLVYVGFEDLFHQYYGSLENIESHYLEKLPLLENQNKVEKVGHLLSDYLFDAENAAPINYHLANNFMKNLVPELKPIQTESNPSPLLSILKLYSNDLAFREWLKDAVIIDVKNNQSVFNDLRRRQTEINKKLERFAPHLHPSVWLFNELNEILGEIDKKETEGIQKNYADANTALSILPRRFTLTNADEIGPYKKYLTKFNDFILHSAYSQFLLKIEPIIELTEFKQAIENLLSKNIISAQLGAKTKRKFLSLMNSTRENNNWDAFFDKYFYIPEKIQDEIKALSKQLTQVEDKLKELYIPEPKEFEALNLSESKINDRIIRINHNVTKRRKLQETENELKKQISKLKAEINKNLIRILTQIRQVKDILESTNSSSSPESLKALYEKSEKDFSSLYKLSNSLIDKLEAEAAQIVEKEDFQINTLKCCMDRHKEEIDNVSEEYNQFILNRKKLRQKLIEQIREEDLTTELADIFNSLYGDLGIYKITDSLSLELAKKESELFKVSLMKAQYLENYQKLLPYSPLSIVSIQFARNILNNTSYQNVDSSYDQAFQSILSRWNSLGSTILPPLPE